MPHSIQSYPPAWKGELLLACRKCQKKLKREPGMRALAKLKKTIKRYNREHPEAPFHLISVACMDMCPKGAVTVCLPATRPLAVSLLRSEGELDKLYPRGS
ncbi:MAG TPA: hypothetical protein VGL53_14515 [Bryobacteraceae bacterium]|jgi:predicted metal-binding protein